LLKYHAFVWNPQPKLGYAQGSPIVRDYFAIFSGFSDWEKKLDLTLEFLIAGPMNFREP
jgi:hypothetical protein